MVTHEIEHNGRLAIITLAYGGERVVTASGYLVVESGEARLYLVSLWEARRVPPHRLSHVALARFAKALGASHLVPVDHGVVGSPGRVTAANLNGGFVAVLPATTLETLEQKLALIPDRPQTG